MSDEITVKACQRLRSESTTCGKGFCEANAFQIKIRQLERDLAAKQAKIDSLMFEYCPSEMTEKQIKNWENHQKPASNV